LRCRVEYQQFGVSPVGPKKRNRFKPLCNQFPSEKSGFGSFYSPRHMATELESMRRHALKSKARWDGMKTMASIEKQNGAVKKTVLAVALTFAAFVCLAGPAAAQGSRKDDIVFGPSGHPIAGATVTVCQPTATGTPCAPLATIYTDATMTVVAPNPFQADGIGNYHFYAPAGRYLLQITGPQITGALTYPDVILPADVSSSGSGNNIPAFGLTLGGNLTVAGNATRNIAALESGSREYVRWNGGPGDWHRCCDFSNGLHLGAGMHGK
jgi:hypothetical protein